MTKIPSGLIVLLLLYCQEYLVAPQMTKSHEKEYISFNCKNENGTDGRVGGDSRPRLLYYAYETGFDFSEKACAEKFKSYIETQQWSSGHERFFNDHKPCVLNRATRIESLNLIAIDLTLDFFQQTPGTLILETNVKSNEANISQIAITSNGPRLYTFYTRGDFDFMQQTTKCAGVSNITKKIRGNRITNPVVDWVTSNVYYISDSRIMVCERYFVICATLPTANNVATKTLFLAISPEQRLLFSVVEHQKLESYHLLAHSLDNFSKPLSLVYIHQREPKWITVDSAQERIYWSEGCCKQKWLLVSSSNFEGKDLKKPLFSLTSLSTDILLDLPFAVFNNTIYWLSTDKECISKCPVDNCQNSISSFRYFNRKAQNPVRIELGYPIIDYRSSNFINRTDSCNVSSCSHLCLPKSETEYQCYCQHSENTISLSNKNNGFCEDHTLLATYKNILYVVGLPDDDFSTPKICEHKINISSIAAITYDSISGNVILTEVGRQKIHLWLPRTKELLLISDEGYGTINSLAFDHYANNLYWIDPSYRVIKAMNLRTCVKVDIVKENSSYVPIQFVLIPSTGYMAVLFLARNFSIAVDYGISMDGRSDTQHVLHMDDEIEYSYDVEDLSLYYWKENQTICLLNRRANTIRYFPIDGSPELRPSIKKEGMNNIKSLAFLKNSIIWSEEDFVIQKAQVSFHDLLVSRPRAPKISLLPFSTTDLDHAENGVFRIFGIERQILKAAECLQNNGDCGEEEMCLVSLAYPHVRCVRPESENSTSNIFCERIRQLQSRQSKMDTTWLDTNLDSIISNAKNSTNPTQYQSTSIISADSIHWFMLIVTFLTMVSFMGYLFLRTISFVKKRIGRFRQREEWTSVSYWDAGNQFPSSYSCDDDDYY